MFHHGLKPGDSVNNQGLREIFKCGLQGGMRRSHATNTLIIISDPTKGIYDDRWMGDVFHYTGMGLKGDQSLHYAQNRTLAQSDTNEVEVYLFEVFEKGKYTHRGQVKLAGEPYQEDQLDTDENLRRVWVFPLIIEGEPHSLQIPDNLILKKQEIKEKQARKLSLEELEKRARYSQKQASLRQVSTTSFERNPYVAELAKRRAEGTCQLCENSAPFEDKKGKPFLETHHIEWLSKGGEDTIENTVALCPNCHRKMHSLNLKSDRNKLSTKAAEFAL